MALVDAVNKVARRIPAWPLYIVAIIPPVVMFYWAVTGRLGVDPVKSSNTKWASLASRS